MFNSITVAPTQFVARDIEVHEHRAPTDMSVTLLRELEKAAQEKTLSIHRLKDNVLDAVWHIIDNPMDFELIGKCRYKLNGQEREFEIVLDRHARSEDHARKIVAKMIEAMSENLAREFFKQSHFESILLRR